MKQQEAFDILNAQLKDIPKVQIRSLSLAVLPRLINVLDTHMDKCPHCRKFNIEGEAFINNIAPLFKDDISSRKQFEQWVDESQKHLKIEHKLQVSGRITSAYTAIGMALGAIIAFGVSLLLENANTLANVSIGWALGMLTGYMTGKITENKLKQDNKLY
ncbi:hypothetical protein KDU71_09015 [Carboxylicivirga sediminis]|uniref:Glycine zipper family protein n=1 Tax=Carboxylicivirga sediminis TaxID=2006564 RepID=A0A941IWD8_9BACT|nr:hypothetical protein [Carboxylicivirga sediminis]MBR8535696.1 hypothetical protein [Carboxylicivirga sediminis]